VLLEDAIREIHTRSRGTYGMLRITAALEIEQGIIVNKKLVWKLMRRMGLKGLPGPKKGKKNLVNLATAEDLVERVFEATGPNELWLTDITEHPTREGKVYCCCVLDMFSRRVVGWAIDRHADTHLVKAAITMAADTRSLATGAVLHSDHGSQGEFKESSQHLETEVVGSGNRKATVSCSRDARSDVVARSTVNSPSRGSHQVLGSNRTRVVK
jgi:transposase InsO family protein